METFVWIEQFEEVREWLFDEHDYTVVQETDAENRLEPAESTIYIDSRQWAEYRFYTLLHEVGHLLVSSDWHGYFDTDGAKMIDCHFDGRKGRRQTFRVATIIEEGAAWKFGLQLANMLDLRVDEKKYDEFMTKHMMSYMLWAVE